MKLLSILLLSLSLYGAGFWTLTGVDKANIYVSNKIAYLKVSTQDSIKKIMKQKLEQLDIKTDAQDAPTLMMTLEELDGDEIHYIYMKLQLGEEVKTFRDNEAEAFVISFEESDFVEADADELDAVVLESAEYLMAKFEEQFEDDKE